MDVYSAELNGVRAMAAPDSLPGSGHSAVALETAQAPQNEESQSTDSADVSGANGEAAGADLHCDQLVICKQAQTQELLKFSNKWPLVSF